MNIAIVGTGRMAKARAAAFSRVPGGRIKIVCSRNPARGRAFLEENRVDATVVADWRDAVVSPEIDSVVVTGPNATHEVVAIAALEAGKHVFLEYPPAVNPAAVDRIAAASCSNTRAVHVGLTHRYGAAHEAMRRLVGGTPVGIAAGTSAGTSMGKLVSYQRTICSGNPISRWYDDDELSGGIFVASLYHHIDETLSLAGDFDTFHASYWVDRGEDRKIRMDRGAITIDHRSGCVSNIVYARGFPKPGIGSRTLAIFEGGYMVADADGIRILEPSGQRKLEPLQNDAVYEDVLAFTSLVESGNVKDGTLESSRRTLELAAGAQQAVQKSAV